MLNSQPGPEEAEDLAVTPLGKVAMRTVQDVCTHELLWVSQTVGSGSPFKAHIISNKSHID